MKARWNIVIEQLQANGDDGVAEWFDKIYMSHGWNLWNYAASGVTSINPNQNLIEGWHKAIKHDFTNNLNRVQPREFIKSGLHGIMNLSVQKYTTPTSHEYSILRSARLLLPGPDVHTVNVSYTQTVITELLYVNTLQAYVLTKFHVSTFQLYVLTNYYVNTFERYVLTNLHDTTEIWLPVTHPDYEHAHSRCDQRPLVLQHIPIR